LQRVLKCRTEQEVVAILGRPADVLLTPEEADAGSLSSFHFPDHPKACAAKRWIGRNIVIEVWFYPNAGNTWFRYWVAESRSWWETWGNRWSQPIIPLRGTQKE